MLLGTANSFVFGHNCIITQEVSNHQVSVTDLKIAKDIELVTESFMDNAIKSTHYFLCGT